MLKHETKLIDPDAEEIVAALTQATEDANKRCRARLLADDAAKWRKFARDAAAKPEGWAMFRGGKGGIPATQVLAAWWTDTIGRKHLVIRGRRVEHDDAKRLLYKEELEKRSPLWHAYPEYVCRRTVGKKSLVVCACGCGAVGTPEALGWMGETCGPCFDRAQEAPDALRGNVPGVLYAERGPLSAVACSPDGTRAAAAEEAGGFGISGHITYWNLTTRTRTAAKLDGTRVADVAFASDGACLVAVGVPFTSGGVWVALDTKTDPPQRLDTPADPRPAGWRVLPLPDPSLMLVHRPHADSPHSRGEVVRVPGGEVVRAINLTPGCSGRLALSPDGTRLAVPGSPVTVFDLGTGKRVCEITGFYTHVAFATDGKHIIGGYSQTIRAFDAITGTPLAKGVRVGAAWNAVNALAVDPRGEWVFVGGGDGSVTAFGAGTLDRRATFEWHLGHVTGLAVSADGTRLFSAGGDGCVKVWPIRDLMR